MRDMEDFLDLNKVPQSLIEYHPGCLAQKALQAGGELRPDFYTGQVDSSREFYHILRKHPTRASNSITEILTNDFPYRPLWEGLHEYASKHEGGIVGCPTVLTIELYRLREELNESTLYQPDNTGKLSSKLLGISREYGVAWMKVINFVRLSIERETQMAWDAAPDSIKRIMRQMRKAPYN